MGGFAQNKNGVGSSTSIAPVGLGASDGNAGSKGCCGSKAILYGRRAVVTEIPYLTRPEAASRVRGVMVFTVPSTSSLPQRPQFEYLVIH